MVALWSRTKFPCKATHQNILLIHRHTSSSLPVCPVPSSDNIFLFFDHANQSSFEIRVTENRPSLALLILPLRGRILSVPESAYLFLI
jgi:hypothetical protein